MKKGFTYEVSRLLIVTLLLGGLGFFLILEFEFSLWAFFLGILLANFMEYSVHRWILHQKPKWFPKAYRIHSGKHHKQYTHKKMNIDSSMEDSLEVLTRPILIVKILMVGATISLLPLFMFGFYFGMVCFGSMVIYYIIYEWVHFLTHFSRDHWIYKITLMGMIKDHHEIHHDTRLMRKWNFNVLFPLWDYIFRTKFRQEL